MNRVFIARTARRVVASAVLLLCLLPRPAHAYAVLTHEEVVDMAWLQHMVPLLKARFPGLTEDQIREAHAFAYGGCILQDLGYYPHGSKLFSDLAHYVRSGDFVQALLDDSTTPDEFAFAMGALAHYTSDEIGHPAVNIVTAQEFPRLRKHYGSTVTYENAPSHHLRTEFGFDVVGVSRGHYAQEDYRTLIGFEVAKPLLERAFAETYGMPLKDVVPDLDSAIGSCRWAVHTLIPKITKVALLSYHDNIEHANPGAARDTFLFRMNRTEYERSWGNKYKKPGFGSHLLAALLRVVPKVGPLKALKLKLPDADQQTLYIKSVNQTVDVLSARLDRMRAVTSAVPLPVAAESNGKDADAGTAKTDDNPHEETNAGAATATTAAGPSEAIGETPLRLPSMDLDTGKMTAPGEYRLADETYAELLENVAKMPATAANAGVRHDLLLYFGAEHDAKNFVHAKRKDWEKVQTALARLKAQGNPPEKPLPVSGSH